MDFAVQLLLWLTVQEFGFLRGTLGYFNKAIEVAQVGEIWKGKIDEMDYFNEFKEGTGYGKEWIFFPDGDDVPHFVNLSLPDVLPTSRGLKVKEIEYRLYSRNIYDYVLLDQAANPIGDVNIGKLLSNKPIKLVTHGWMSSADKSVIVGIKNAYLAVKDVIVIGIDWSDTAMDLLYPAVADETGGIGSRLGQFVSALCARYGVSGDRLHLIGHSLGAHVMGIAASSSSVTFGRITGLDPARPLFEFPKRPDSLSLDKSDAKFVDVIHSCGGVLGVENAIGHADFYPNSGGAPQPGCDSIFYLFEACSHSRSHMYFAESITNPTAFLACRNENWNDYLTGKKCSHQTCMGESVDHQAKGQYYLKTNSKEPYGSINVQ